MLLSPKGFSNKTWNHIKYWLNEIEHWCSNQVVYVYVCVCVGGEIFLSNGDVILSLFRYYPLYGYSDITLCMDIQI